MKYFQKQVFSLHRSEMKCRVFKGLPVGAVGQTARIVLAHVCLVKKVFKRCGTLGNFVILSAAVAVLCDSSPVSKFIRYV